MLFEKGNILKNIYLGVWRATSGEKRGYKMINFIRLKNYKGKISDISIKQLIRKRPLGTLSEDDIYIRHSTPPRRNGGARAEQILLTLADL